MKHSLFLITAYFFSFTGAFPQPLDTSVHRVLFLGNSITYNGTFITDMEACYTLWHPAQKIEFINLGLPSETVSGLSEDGHADGRFPRPDLHERLHRILASLKPDVVFADYGMNDGIYLPLEESRFKRYRQGMEWLHDTLAATGARVIMVTPPVYDEQRAGAKGYAAVLDAYADWLLSRQKTAGWEVADIHFAMKKYLEAHRKLDKSFGINGFALADDGVHPGAAGHWLMARQLLLHLHEKQALSYPDIHSVITAHVHGRQIAALIAERQHFMKDAWLSATGHTRPEMTAGMPMEQARLRSAAISVSLEALQ